MFELVQLSPDAGSGPRLGVEVAGGGGELLLVPGGGLLQPPHLGQHGLQLGGGGLGGGPPGADTVPVLQLVLTLQTSLLNRGHYQVR